MKTLMLNLLILLQISCATIFMGCTYSGAIRTDISPTAMVGKKYPAKVGIYFAPRLEQYEEVTKPSYDSVHTFKFNMGPAIKEALTKSVEAAYSNVSIISESSGARDQSSQPEFLDETVSFSEC